MGVARGWGRAVAVPAGVDGALEMAKKVSNVMFGFYIAGIGFSTVSLVIGELDHPLHSYPKSDPICMYVCII